MATTTFVNNTTVSKDDWFNDVDATIYEQHGVGKTTVASATSPDIFAATVGHFIDYTGTATCTGFAAAVSAGSHRELYCAGACLFTAGANLLIEGIPSGTTITLAAGALVQVRAITTTQFKMAYSVSGTFTATLTGCTTSPTVTASYSVTNGVATVFYPANSGTSNTTAMTLTGAPAAIKPTTAHSGFVYTIVDNTANLFGRADVSTEGVVTFSTSAAGGAFTASGLKGNYSLSLTYTLT